MTFADYVIFISFLGLTLFIGTYAGRNVKDLSQFAVGGRRYGVFALFSTLSASYIGGGYTFGLSEKVFISGAVYILCLLGFSLQQLLVGKFLAPKMVAYRDSYSVGDIIAKHYGQTGRIITGVASVIVCAGIIGAQVGATGYVFKLFLGIDKVWGILIGCGIMIAYSIVGGMRAVVATDMLQFSVLAISIPLALIFGVINAGGLGAVLQSVPVEHISFPGNLSYITMASLFLSLLLGEALVPPYVQRLFIARNESVTRRATIGSGLMSIPFFVCAGAVGLVALVLSPSLDSNMALPYVIQNALPIGLSGLAQAGIIAVVMSSADSYLNAASIATIHDIYRPIKGDNISPERELKLMRFATLAIGAFSVLFALSIESVLEILLYSYNFWSPIVLVPLVMAILGKRISLHGFMVSGLIGVSSVLIWNMLLNGDKLWGFDGLVIGVFANFSAFMYFKCKREESSSSKVVKSESV